jgi:plastocyanin
MKKMISLLALLTAFTLLLAACGSSTTSTGSNSNTNSTGSNASNQTVTVNTTSNNFAQPSVTLKKGDTLELVNQASDIHLISLGQWVNGQAKPENEPGAPSVQNVELAGNSSITIGPWNTPGTYHLYCTVHTGMNLTVNVTA